MNDLITKTFDASPIRIVTVDGNPWFVAVDVCRALALPNETNAIRRLDDSEKGVSQFNSLGGTQPTSIISESGLYKLIMRCDKPEARRFWDRITRDVLPAIRKDGGYIMGEEKVATGEMSEDELVLKAMQVMSGKVTRLKAENTRMATELNNVTVDEYRALSHVY